MPDRKTITIPVTITIRQGAAPVLRVPETPVGTVEPDLESMARRHLDEYFKAIKEASDLGLEPSDEFKEMWANRPEEVARRMREDVTATVKRYFRQ